MLDSDGLTTRRFVDAINAGIAVGAHDLVGGSSPHTASGLTTGWFLKALSATTFGFAALGAGDIQSGQLAVARGGTGADLSGTGGAGYVLRQSGVGAAVTVSGLTAADVAAGTFPGASYVFGKNIHVTDGAEANVWFDYTGGTPLSTFLYVANDAFGAWDNTRNRALWTITPSTQAVVFPAAVSMGALTATTGSFTGDVQVGPAPGAYGYVAMRDGSDTAGLGARYQLVNAAGTRYWMTQLSASNHYFWWYYDGAAWGNVASLTNTGAFYAAFLRATSASAGYQIEWATGTSKVWGFSTNDNYTFLNNLTDGVQIASFANGGAVNFGANAVAMGALTATSLQTAAPAGGTAGVWKAGIYVASAPAATGYVQLDIGGTLYKLLAST